MTTTLTNVEPIAPNMLQLTFSAPLNPDVNLYSRNNYVIQTRFGPDVPVYAQNILFSSLLATPTVYVQTMDAMLTRGLYKMQVLNVLDASMQAVSSAPFYFEGDGLPQKCFDIKKHMPPDAFATAYGTVCGTHLEASGMEFDSLVGDTGSTLALAQQALCLRTAQGDDLTIIGQNYGVTRPDYAITNDDLFRVLIPLYSTQPKGTLGTLSAVLTAIVGPQATAGWVISDVLPNQPTVQIPRAALLGPESGQGSLLGPDAYTTYLHADSTVDAASTYPGDYLTATPDLPDATEQGDVVMLYSTIQAINEAFQTLAPAGITIQVVLT